MTFATSTDRPVSPPGKPNLKTYLDHLDQLCQVLAAKEEQKGEDDRPWPWLTLVLGSGCSRSPQEVAPLSALVDSVCAGVRAASKVPHVDGTPIDDYIRTFLVDLVEDRAQIDIRPSLSGVSDADAPRWLHELTLASALTSHLYFACKSLTPAAPRRSPSDDEATLPSSSLALLRYLRRDVVTPACAAVESALESLEAVEHDLSDALNFGDRTTRRPASHFTELLKALLDQLRVQYKAEDDLRLQWADVDALAEVVWFCLSCLAAPAAYPGWTDLMLNLTWSLGTRPNDGQAVRGGTRVPTLRNLTSASDTIGQWYRSATSHGRRDDRHTIHDAAAAVLIAEAKFREEAKEGVRTPAPSAFVTSFDLELERALIDASASFLLIVPAHLVSKQTAHTCWLSLSVDGSQAPSGLDQLLEAGTADWRVVHAKSIDETRQPIVVRLAGCPSVRLPKLEEGSPLRSELLTIFDSALQAQHGDDEQKKKEIESNLALHPAILLNEHDATWHNFLDLTSKGASPTSSLPPTLVEAHGMWRRFWILLGVQVQDSAIRNRIAALISSVPMVESGEPSGSGRLGVAVNRRLAAVERELLQWAGLDVIAGSDANVDDFDGDLRHYPEHLIQAYGDPTKLRFKREGCPL